MVYNILMLRVLLLLSFLPICAHACGWDRDTLAAEAKGVPQAVRVITGRFPRNPPLYYEMRLKRVATQIEKEPSRLELYDDAGVACDRLARGDAAIEWMNKKRRQLEKRDAKDKNVRDHWYRYHANIGTFYAHRWLRAGANRKRIGELETARDHIERAISINPDAHFGREKYQLQAMQWMLHPPKVKADEMGLPTFYKWSKQTPAKAAVKGLNGLIVLGAAWQSVDTFNALAEALQSDDQRTSVSFMARLRAAELVDGGKRSTLPTAPIGAALKKLFLNPNPLTDSAILEDDKKVEVKKQFRELRREADEWQRQRTDYMMSRLQAGRHPDTDANFWKQWKEIPAPVIQPIKPPAPRSPFYAVGAVLILFIVVLFALIMRLKDRIPPEVEN